MKKLTLNATSRTELGKKANSLRNQKKVPVILYGQGIKSQPLTVEWSEFLHIFREAGESTLVDLLVEGAKPVKVLITEPQYDPITDKIIHADLKQIRMDKPIRTDVPIVVIGERDALAVRDLEGNLILNKDRVEIECLPADLISEIETNVSGLATFEDKIHVKDLNVPENVKILDEPEEVIALVTPPRSEEELEELEEKPVEEVEAVEVEEKGKAEEGKEEAGTETAPAETSENAPKPDSPQSP